MDQKTLNKEFKVSDGLITIVETVEKHLSKEELQMEKSQYINRQAQLTRQIAELQRQYNSFIDVIADIDNMISKIDEQTIDI